MILSVSRRTDIPAFYADWFINRIKEGYALARNPMNYRQVSKIDINPDVIDCIVFWTKDPTNMLNKLDEIKKYHYYFQISINPYDKSMEKHVPKKNRIIDSVLKLSQKIGSDKIIWRYDPILLANKIDIEYHEKYFEILASKLSGYIRKCKISFINQYKKTERNMKSIEQCPIDEKTMLCLGHKLSNIARKYGFVIESCAESIDLSSVGIEHGKCIDDHLISSIIGEKLSIEKDKNQRDFCGCVASIDIGAYSTCKHGCVYCYANFSDTAIKNNIMKHDINSPLLIGSIEDEDKIIERKMKSYLPCC